MIATPAALPRNAQRGLTLVDLLCALAVVAVLLRGAIPAMQDMLLRQVLMSTAGTVETDVQYARSMAMTADMPVRLSIQTNPDGGSCTVVHTGDAHACRCDGRQHYHCTGPATLLRLSEQPFKRGASIVGKERSLVFSPSHGTVTPTATLVLTDTNGRSLRKIVNVMGRMRTCSEDGFPGIPNCA